MSVFRVLVFAVLIATSSCKKEGSVAGNDNSLPNVKSPEFERYHKVVFNDFTITTVPYGENTTQGGKKQLLEVDIYQPKGDDLKKRPLFIYAFGGGFTQGSKEGIKGLGFLQHLAKSGFVVASIDYRLIDVEINSRSRALGIFNAIEDMRAAIRFFRKDADTQNTFKIDTNQIFIGGYSAGAITALHTAYLDSEEKIVAYTPTIKPYLDAHGGIEGNSGNSGYSSKVKGVINIAGAIFDESMVNKGDAILYSLHGEADVTVPIGASEVLQGSRVIHKQATKVGIENKLNAVPELGHDILYVCKPCRAGLQKFLAKHVK